MATNYIVIIFRVKGGDVFEQPVYGYDRYWQAVRAALQFHGLARNDVIICLE
jgi:hypothetical protein